MGNLPIICRCCSQESEVCNTEFCSSLDCHTRFHNFFLRGMWFGCTDSINPPTSASGGRSVFVCASGDRGGPDGGVINRVVFSDFPSRMGGWGGGARHGRTDDEEFINAHVRVRVLLPNHYALVGTYNIIIYIRIRIKCGWTDRRDYLRSYKSRARRQGQLKHPKIMLTENAMCRRPSLYYR